MNKIIEVEINWLKREKEHNGKRDGTFITYHNLQWIITGIDEFTGN